MFHFGSADGKAVSCCSEDGTSFAPKMHYACMPIEIEDRDPFYAQFNQKCINVVRSALADGDQCNLGYAKQVN